MRFKPRFQEVIEDARRKSKFGFPSKFFCKLARKETRLGENHMVNFVGMLSQIGRSQHGSPRVRHKVNRLAATIMIDDGIEIGDS